MAPRLTEVFMLREEPRMGGRMTSPRPDDRHLDHPVAQEVSRLFGQIERSINEVKLALERLPLPREYIYRKLDDLGDHATEIFRNVVDGDPMVRWVRQTGQAGQSEGTMDGPLSHVMAV